MSEIHGRSQNFGTNVLFVVLQVRDVYVFCNFKLAF